MDLLPAIKAQLEQMVALEKEYQTKLNGLEMGLEALREMNTTCETCEGLGRFLEAVPADSGDDYVRQFVSCPVCKGTGYTPNRERKEADELMKGGS